MKKIRVSQYSCKLLLVNKKSRLIESDEEDVINTVFSQARENKEMDIVNQIVSKKNEKE